MGFMMSWLPFKAVYVYIIVSCWYIHTTEVSTNQLKRLFLLISCSVYAIICLCKPFSCMHLSLSINTMAAFGHFVNSYHSSMSQYVCATLQGFVCLYIYIIYQHENYLLPVYILHILLYTCIIYV